MYVVTYFKMALTKFGCNSKLVIVGYKTFRNPVVYFQEGMINLVSLSL